MYYAKARKGNSEYITRCRGCGLNEVRYLKSGLCDNCTRLRDRKDGYLRDEPVVAALAGEASAIGTLQAPFPTVEETAPVETLDTPSYNIASVQTFDHPAVHIKEEGAGFLKQFALVGLLGLGVGFGLGYLFRKSN